MSACIVIFARALALGQVKTRIAAEADASTALAIYRQMLERSIQQASVTGRDVFIYATATDCPELNALASRYGCRVCLQQGEDLGRKMAHALHQQHQDYAQVILIGSDAPVIDAAHLYSAIEALRAHDIAITPAEDGGFVLIASRHGSVWRNDLFDAVTWSCAQTLEQALSCLHALQVRVTMLNTLWDVDTLADATRAEAMGLLVLP